MKRFSLKHILVPVDLAEPSLSALRVAKSLGRSSGALLDVLHMQEVPPSLAFAPGGAKAAAKAQKEFKSHLLKRLEAETSDYPKSKVSVHTYTGYASVVLSRLTKKRPSGLVVIGTHGYTGIRHVLFGSVAETLVRRSHIPVLGVHERKAPFKLGKILVPMNLTEYAGKALLYALDLAGTARARVSVLHVADRRMGSYDPDKLLKSHLRDVLGSRKTQLKTIVRQGNPERVILEEAAVGKFDLIVLAAHRRRFWKDVILGMTAERVLRYSPIPVLSVPSSAPGK